MESDDQRLVWVQRNRERRVTEKPVGSLMASVVGRLVGETGEESAAIVNAIAGAVDSAFRCHCRVSIVSPAAIDINVDEAALVFAYRTRFLPAIRKALKDAGRSAGRSRIRFVCGNVGLPLGDGPPSP